MHRKLYDEVKDEKGREKALELIETEEDIKYGKKHASLWRVIGGSDNRGNAYV